MGSTKEWMMELKDERMLQWMRKSFDIPEETEIDEDYPGFEGMAAVYQDELDKEEYLAHMKWFEEHPYLETYSIFTDNLKSLKVMVSQGTNPFDDNTIHKMVYAHAVTLFEAMVADIIKTVLVSYSSLMNRFIDKLAEDKSLKFTVREIAEMGINGIVINIINAQTFHNPLTVKNYVNLITGKILPDTHMAKMRKVIEIRHDFVHRNGKTMAGNYHNVDTALVISSIETIENFAHDVFQILSAAMNNK
jgi:hypothetical protein